MMVGSSMREKDLWKAWTRDWAGALLWVLDSAPFAVDAMRVLEVVEEAQYIARTAPRGDRVAKEMAIQALLEEQWPTEERHWPEREFYRDMAKSATRWRVWPRRWRGKPPADVCGIERAGCNKEAKPRRTTR